MRAGGVSGRLLGSTTLASLAVRLRLSGFHVGLECRLRDLVVDPCESHRSGVEHFRFSFVVPNNDKREAYTHDLARERGFAWATDDLLNVQLIVTDRVITQHEVLLLDVERDDIRADTDVFGRE